MKATAVARRRMRERLHAATIRHEFLDLPWQPAYPIVLPGSLLQSRFYISSEGWVQP